MAPRTCDSQGEKAQLTRQDLGAEELTRKWRTPWKFEYSGLENPPILGGGYVGFRKCRRVYGR